MTIQTRVGARCKTLQNVLTAHGIVPRNSVGILRDERRWFGRHLVFVEWESGGCSPVSPSELAIWRQKNVSTPTSLTLGDPQAFIIEPERTTSIRRSDTSESAQAGRPPVRWSSDALGESTL
jgi:hypothetical protein